MNEAGAAGPIPAERRKALLARAPGFVGLPAKFLEKLAASLREEHHPRGRAGAAEALLTVKYLKKKPLHPP